MAEGREADPTRNLSLFPPDRFISERSEGDGGQSPSVLKAWDTQLTRFVACKLFLNKDAFASLDEDDLTELGITKGEGEALAALGSLSTRYTPLREARLMSLVDHPNVISVIDVGLLDPGTVALVMPYVDGGTLAGRSFSGSWDHGLDIAMQIGRGLAAIHDAQLLHRDIKPANILLRRSGRPVIADFGLACFVDERDALAERVGTHEYMAPEVLTRGFRDVRDDLYSYCKVVYEMFYGQPPFASPEDAEAGRVSRPRRSTDAPGRLFEILERGLAPDADRRWSNMKVLLRELDQVRTAKPRRWPWIVSAGAACLLTVGVLVARSARADACDAVARELDPIWDEDVIVELRSVLRTSRAGDRLRDWGRQWVEVRARECEVARAAPPSPCTAMAQQRFLMTLRALRSPHRRVGLDLTKVIAELPSPQHCLEHPEDETWAQGGLLELDELEAEIGTRVTSGDLEYASTLRLDYMRQAIAHHSTFDTARAIFWQGEISRLRGELDEAQQRFEWAYADAQKLELPVFAAEVHTKLAAVAGARGELEAADAFAFSARATFEAHRPDRVAEVLDVHGLALLAGPEAARERGVELLRQALELREEQVRKHGGSRELITLAQESHARGLLAVDRAGEALEVLEHALQVHQEDWGHGTLHGRSILRLEFQALVQLGRLRKAEVAHQAILAADRDDEAWSTYFEDVLWIAEVYADEVGASPAALVLQDARNVATELDSLSDVERIDLALYRLGMK